MKRIYKGWTIQKIGVTWTAKKGLEFLDHFPYLNRLKRHIDGLTGELR